MPLNKASRATSKRKSSQNGKHPSSPTASGFQIRVTGFESIAKKKLVPDPANHRIHTERQKTALSAVLNEVGFAGACLVRPLPRGKYGIIDGHERFERFAPDELVPCLITDLTDDEAKKVLASFDQIGALAEIDTEKLQSLLDSVDFESPDLKGLIDSTIEDALVAVAEMNDETPDLKSGNTDPDDIPVKPKKAKCKPGELYLLGEHRLLCGDATSKQQVAELLQDDQVDLFLTDPPYNVEYVGKTKEQLTIKNDKMEANAFQTFLNAAFQNANDHMKAGASYYIWHASNESVAFNLACANCEWPVRQTLIWQKQAFVLSRQDYHWKHEPCLYGWKPGARHRWFGGRKQTTLLEFDRPVKNDEHPTMKPVPLLVQLIINSSQDNDTVLDLFGGSGSTLMACEQTNRHARLMELDPIYCDVIIKRWEAFTGSKATPAN